MPHRRVAVLLFAVFALMVFAAPVAARTQKSNAKEAVAERTMESAGVVSLRVGIDFWRQATWRWQQLVGRPRTRTSYHDKWVKGKGYLRWMAKLWQARAMQSKTQAQNPPHKEQWLCIKSYEGSWQDPNPPHWGGLQMDLTFQRTYGPELLQRKGTANNWTPLEQMWVAERAHSSGRGFYPWPNTARACGLI